MPKRKLTESLKKKLKKDYNKVKKSDYSGEALTYLNRVRGAAKGRKAKKKIHKEKVEEIKASLHICGRVIAPGSEAWNIIAASARLKKQSIYKYASLNEEAICKLINDFLIFANKEIDYLINEISELPKSKKVFVPVKGKEITRTKAIFILHSLKSFMISTMGIYEQILIDYAYDLFGNIHFDAPYPIQYTRYKEDGEMDGFLDENFSNISYFKND